MKRRALLSVGGGTLLMPRIAQALPNRIAVLGPDATDGQGPVWDAFVDELARRGQVVGRDIDFERRFGSGDQPAQLERLAQELTALRPDLIYAARGTASTLAVERASVTIPIVVHERFSAVIAAAPHRARPRPIGFAAEVEHD